MMSNFFYVLIYCAISVTLHTSLSLLICYCGYRLVNDLKSLYPKEPRYIRRILLEPTKNRVQPVPPPSFADPLQIWHMAMDDRQPRRTYLLTEDHMEKLKKANPSLMKHGDKPRKMFDSNEPTVQCDNTLVTEDLTKTTANERRTKKLKNLTTRTARTEEVEARWRKRKE